MEESQQKFPTSQSEGARVLNDAYSVLVQEPQALATCFLPSLGRGLSGSQLLCFQCQGPPQKDRSKSTVELCYTNRKLRI